MKVIAINGSPRKNWNTAIMLQSALEGAKADGAETELINLYDYEYKGCVSCLACKRKGSKANGLCAYKDALSTILEKCKEGKFNKQQAFQIRLGLQHELPAKTILKYAKPSY